MNMKYINSKIVCGALSMLTLMGMTSCGDDFLKEDAGHKYTDALLETSDGASLYGCRTLCKPALAFRL